MGRDIFPFWVKCCAWMQWSPILLKILAIYVPSFVALNFFGKILGHSPSTDLNPNNFHLNGLLMTGWVFNFNFTWFGVQSMCEVMVRTKYDRHMNSLSVSFVPHQGTWIYYIIEVVKAGRLGRNLSPRIYKYQFMLACKLPYKFNSIAKSMIAISSSDNRFFYSHYKDTIWYGVLMASCIVF